MLYLQPLNLLFYYFLTLQKSLSLNLKCKKKLFTDKTYDKQDMIKYCEDLIKNPPIIKTTKEKVVIRDYQKEAIQLIKDMKNNFFYFK